MSTTDIVPQTLILKHYRRHLSKFHISVLMLVLVLTFAIMAAFTLLAHPEILQWTVQQWQEVLVIQWQRYRTSSLFYLNTFILLLSVYQLLSTLFAHFYERVELGLQGIRYVPPLPTWLRFVPLGWQFSWQEIQAIKTKPATISLNRLGLKLELHSNKRKKSLNPLYWIDLQAPHDARPTQAWQAFTDAELQHALQHSPLWRYAQTQNLVFNALTQAPEPIPENFDLLKHPYTSKALYVFFALLFYAVIDFNLNRENYINVPFMYFITGGAVFGSFAFAGLSSKGIPAAEHGVLSLFLAGAMAFTLYPALLRVNQFTDMQGLQSHVYHIHEDFSLHPVEPELPVIQMRKNLDYWGQFPVNGEYRLNLRQGGLGFYQLNWVAIEQDMREFYKAQRKK